MNKRHKTREVRGHVEHEAREAREHVEHEACHLAVSNYFRYNIQMIY